MQDLWDPPKRVLMPHQDEAMVYGQGRDHLALYMEMRLGKTLVTIRWVQDLELVRGENIKNVLVIAPTTVLRGWRKELSEEEEIPTMVGGLPREKREQVLVDSFNNPYRNWCLINFESLIYTPGITMLPWDVVIIDESAKIRNPKTKITQQVTKGFRQVKHRVILSGLPAPESELDFFCQFQFLHGSFMGCSNWYNFRATYFHETWDGWKPKPGAKVQIKNMVHKKAFVLTRSAAGIGSKKIYETRYVKMSKEQREINDQIWRNFEFDTVEGTTKETEYVIVRSTWLARVAGGYTPDTPPVRIGSGKIEELLALLGGELSGEQVVVWFRFNDELRGVAESLRENGITYESILGETSPEDREKRRLLFMGGQRRVLLVQIKCAPYGNDFSAASVAVYYSNSYSNDERTQSEDRILHPKKKEPLLIIDFMTEGSIDEEVIPALQRKSFNSRYLMTKIKDELDRRNPARKIK